MAFCICSAGCSWSPCRAAYNQPYEGTTIDANVGLINLMVASGHAESPSEECGMQLSPCVVANCLALKDGDRRREMRFSSKFTNYFPESSFHEVTSSYVHMYLV
jgi:hypothetical protein